MVRSTGFDIPPEVSRVTNTLEKRGFEAHLVGGCVRSLFLNMKPKDWDVATNAKPEDITGMFENTFYNNEYGTVGVVNDATEDESLKVVEVTPYRLESAYSDARRPDSVTFGTSLEEDLKRRDFTINAMAYSVSRGNLVDLFGGRDDLRAGVIRAVGKAEDRFSEDALRILRAVRLAAEIGFSIEEETATAIKKTAKNLDKIAKERIRDEFIRIVNSSRPREALETAHKLGILKQVAPDIERGIGIEQNQAHRYDVFEHNLRTLQHAADKGWSSDLRLAGLFHDISKPETRRWSNEKKDWTFHGHDVVGARVTKNVLTDLKFPKKTIEKVVGLVRWHMFFSDPEKITLSAVRRIIRNVGRENIWTLMDLRVCDRVGTGRPKEQPFRFRKYKSMVEEALRDPISVNMLAIDGAQIMEVTGEGPGPKVGYTLHALLEEVLEEPKKNDLAYLKERAVELSKMKESELRKLGEAGKQKKEEAEEGHIKEIRKKYWVS